MVRTGTECNRSRFQTITNFDLKEELAFIFIIYCFFSCSHSRALSPRLSPASPSSPVSQAFLSRFG